MSAATNWTLYSELASTIRDAGASCAVSQPYKDVILWGTNAQVRRAFAMMGLSADPRHVNTQDWRDLEGKKIATIGYGPDGRAGGTMWFALAMNG